MKIEEKYFIFSVDCRIQMFNARIFETIIVVISIFYCELSGLGDSGTIRQL